MVEALLAALGFLAFVCVTFPPEAWFDVLPRRVARRIGTLLLVVLALIAWAAPSAFQAGTRRFTDRLVAQAQHRGDEIARYVTERDTAAALTVGVRRAAAPLTPGLLRRRGLMLSTVGAAAVRRYFHYLRTAGPATSRAGRP